MKLKKFKTSLIIIVLALLLAGTVVVLKNTKVEYNLAGNDLQTIEVQKNNLIAVAINSALLVEKYDFTVFGGIVPHHDLASEIIADFFARFHEPQKIRRVVILGPNHADKGAKAISYPFAWQTEYGEVMADEEILEQFRIAGLISFDKNNFIIEHSISNILPFIKFYFPEAKVAPIILTSKYDLENDKKLALKLKSITDENTIVIASLDFSHYLKTDIALENDKKTESYIKARDYEAIAKLNSDYLDSPPTLITFLRLMDLLGVEKQKILSHADSGNFLGAQQEFSTSYFSIVFGK